MKIKLLLLIILSLNSCRWLSGSSTPYLAMTNYKIPEGTPLFKKGYSNGCETILHNRGTGYYRDKYNGYKFDPDLIDNPEYQFGFSRGWTNCFNVITGGGHTLGGSADAYIFGGKPGYGGPAFDMGKGNINGVFNYENGTWNNPLNSGGGFNDIFGVVQKGGGGTGATVFGGHPFWGTWQTGQIFGQSD